MEGKLGAAVHLTLEYVFLVCFVVTYFLGYQDALGFWSSGFLVVLVVTWTYFCTLLLHRLGLMNAIFGMEYLEGFERAFGLYSHSSLILLVAQMNKPEDLEGAVK